jgi:hypothetical protein
LVVLNQGRSLFCGPASGLLVEGANLEATFLGMLRGDR